MYIYIWTPLTFFFLGKKKNIWWSEDWLYFHQKELFGLSVYGWVCKGLGEWGCGHMTLLSWGLPSAFKWAVGSQNMGTAFHLCWTKPILYHKGFFFSPTAFQSVVAQWRFYLRSTSLQCQSMQRAIEVNGLYGLTEHDSPSQLGQVPCERWVGFSATN